MSNQIVDFGDPIPPEYYDDKLKEMKKTNKLLRKIIKLLEKQESPWKD